jgi:hypothetical protein
MITINIHLSAPMQARVKRLSSCVTLTLSSEGDEVVYFLKTVEDVRELLNTMCEALDRGSPS